MFRINRFLFCIWLFTQCLCYANNNLNSFDFDKIKNQLFSAESLQNFSESKHRSDDQPNKYNVMECMQELMVIGESLTKLDFWAIKLLDSWGKLPSGILSGNAYDFGAFSQCLHIERDRQKYPTQYCLATITFTMKNLMPMDMRTKVGLLGENNGAAERAIVTKPKDGQTLNIGICLPSVCSPAKIGNQMGKIIGLMFNNVTFAIPESLCQISENNSSPLTTADWVSIGILLGVLCLIVISTCYDLWCTLANKPKLEALLVFSVYTNGMKLLSFDRPKSRDFMQCLHGIRVLSTQWVVLGHTFAGFLILPSQNPIYYIEFASEYISMFILSSRISVDTFLVMSGLLASFTILKHLEKTGGRINILTLYIHRYLRLTPLLVISVLLSITLFRFLGDGPIWPGFVEFFKNQCERHWLSTLLYAQNYVNPDDICFIHSWYLSVDFQLFIIAPFVVYLIYKFKTKAVLCLTYFVVGCVGCTISTYLVNDFENTLMDNNKMIKTYYPTHLRFSPWLIGIFGGYILHESRKKIIRIPRVINLLGWLISLALMAAVIFANYPLVQFDSRPSGLEVGLYDSLSRVAWAIALCYIIFACDNNYGGPVNWFLSHPMWQPLSRICYSIYLVHFPIVMFFNATLKHPSYLSGISAYHMFFGHYILSVSVSIVATLAFESPIIAIEKLIFGKK